MGNKQYIYLFDGSTSITFIIMFGTSCGREGWVFTEELEKLILLETRLTTAYTNCF